MHTCIVIGFMHSHIEISFTPKMILWGSKTWAHVVGLDTTFHQQYVRGEEIIGKPRN